MNDGNLLIFGCAVSLIAISGVYVYLRESFTGQPKPLENKSHENPATNEGVEVHP